LEDTLAALIGSGADLPHRYAPDVAAIAALTGHEGLLGIVRQFLDAGDASREFFQAVCGSAAVHLHDWPVRGLEVARDFAFNLLDMCRTPTSAALEAAYHLLFGAEGYGSPSPAYPEGLPYDVQRVFDREHEDWEESDTPFRYVAYRGLIQQMFEAKQGATTFLYADVPVFVATSRSRNADGHGVASFGSGPTPVPPPGLSFAVARVAVPGFESHVVSLAKPRWWRWFARKAVQRFVEVLAFDHVADKTAFLDAAEQLGRVTPEAEAPKNAIVFVHGYRVTLEQAVEATANLAAKLQFSGVPICYSWPSRGEVVAYSADEAEVPLAGDRLAGLLRLLVEHFGPGAVHLVAHSMGNRVLFEALLILAGRPLSGEIEPQIPRPFGQIVLSAADVFSPDFAARVPVAAALAERVTSYLSEHDFALAASKRFHKGPRAGLERPPIGPARCDPVVCNPPDEYDAIDVSAIHDDLIGHSYFGANPRVVLDIGLVLNGTPATGRSHLLRATDYLIYRQT
jgi:esterase/lipase superfamily enzyme